MSVLQENIDNQKMERPNLFQKLAFVLKRQNDIEQFIDFLLYKEE